MDPKVDFRSVAQLAIAKGWLKGGSATTNPAKAVATKPKVLRKANAYITNAQCMARLRAEQQGLDTSQFPPRVRGKAARLQRLAKINRYRKVTNYWRRRRGEAEVPLLTFEDLQRLEHNKGVGYVPKR